jgi:hypothetical protein
MWRRKALHCYRTTGRCRNCFGRFPFGDGRELSNMPCFHFNIRDGADVIRDEEGMILPDIETARDEARSSAKELAAQEYREKHEVDGRIIEITDSRGRVIEIFPLRNVLHR